MAKRPPQKNTIRPGFVKTAIGKVRLLIQFRLGYLFNMQLLSLYWLLSCLLCSFVFNYVRIKGAIINLDAIHIQLVAFIMGGYCFIRFIACWINKIKINVNTKQLTVIHTPFSFAANKSRLRSPNIVQLYVDFKDSPFLKQYVVLALMKNQEVVEILETTDIKLAQYLETRIEKYLCIEDMKIDGEIEHSDISTKNKQPRLRIVGASNI
jgi:hypothetical protein